MNKIITIILVFLFGIQLTAQDIQIDTVKHDLVITTPIYTSFYSTYHKAPIAVSYILYEGGGDVSRSGINFQNKIPFNHAKGYSKSGYDRGHMVPAKDFSHTRDELKLTFKYYNCVPQTPKLNRGKWKIQESHIRMRSQLDSLYIVCYNSYSNQKINDYVSIPDTCYKAVYVINNGRLTYNDNLSGCFPNDFDNIPIYTKLHTEMVFRMKQYIIK